MTKITQGALTMLGLNTNSPQVFWNGVSVPNITAIRVEWRHDEQRVKLRVTSMEPALKAALRTFGVAIKEKA